VIASVVIARDQLQHITIMMQGEVIKSLQMAVQYDNAVLNLTLLHEASITNRRATFATLDQLKQRLLPRMPINRQLQGRTESFSDTLSPASIRTLGSSTFNPESFIPADYVPHAVTLPSPQDTEVNHGLTNYFRETQRNSGLSGPLSSADSREVKAPDGITFSQAIQHLMHARGTQDRAVIMQEIDEIMDSYQGLHISQGPSDSWSNQQHGYDYNDRRDTLTMPSASNPFSHGPLGSTREAMQVPKNLRPPSEELGSTNYLQQPVFNNGIFNQQQEHPAYHHQQYTAKNPYPHMQTEASGARWSTSSSTYSDSPSLNRNSSTSSQESHTQNQPLPLNHSPRNMGSSMSRKPLSPDAPYQHQDNHYAAQSSSSAPHAPTLERYSQTIAPLAPQYPRGQSTPSPHVTPQTSPPANTATASHDDPNSLMYSSYAAPYQHSPSQAIAPFAFPQQQPVPVPNHTAEKSTPNRPMYHLTPSVARDTSSTHSTASERTITHPTITSTTSKTAPITAAVRHASIAPSIASTDSSNSIPIGILPRLSASIRTSTIQSGPAGQERMMDGRPCKANNYWGFCKGAWTIREEPKKGLQLRTQPSGMFNSRELWECTACTFQGSTFTAPHPTKKNKTITVFDQRVNTSSSQVRYKWLFLAKSHIKKRATDSHTNESNYGCVFCSLEDRVSSVYGGVETLMNHIALCHVGDMSENTRRKARCVIGRVPGKEETEWDINIPVFERVQELP
jgi:hypothetical protein